MINSFYRLLGMAFMIFALSSHLDAQPRIVIVGAGASGLSAAFHLKKEFGLDAQVYEASDRIGGRIYTKVQPGIKVELGASFVDQDHTLLISLAKELGLELAALKDTGRNGRIYLFDNKTLDMSELFETFLPTLKRIQEDINQIEKERSLLAYNELSKKELELDQLSIKDYLEMLHAPSMFVRLVDATQFTEYGARIHKLNALSLLDLISIDLDNKQFTMDGQLGDEGHKIDGGNSLIPEKLAQSLNYPVYLGYQLTEIAHNEKSNTYSLDFYHNKSIEKIEADYVILALPNPVLKNNIKMDHEKLLNHSISKVINEFLYGNVTKFIMVFSKAPWRKEPAELVEILSDRYDIWESSFNERGNDNYHLTVYMGEPDSFVDMDQNPERFADEVLGHLEILYPDIRSAYLGHVPSMHWPSHPFYHGAFSGVFLPGQWGLRHLTQSPGVGNLAFAGEQWSLHNAGFMEGALETGRWAAQYIGERAARTVDIKETAEGISEHLHP